MAYKVLERRPSLQGAQANIGRLLLIVCVRCRSDFEVFRGAETKDETKAVLARRIDWNGYATSNFLTEAEAGLMLQYDKENEETQADLLAEVGSPVLFARHSVRDTVAS